MNGKTKVRPPVKTGDAVQLEIVDLNHAGEGVGSLEGFTVFVPGTAPGDLVTARVISVQKSYARALLDSVARASENRVEPPCGHFGRCGGCALQHLAYEAQLKYKQKILADALRRIGGLQVPVPPVLGMADPWRYRNKAQVPVAAGSGGRVAAGFYEPRSHSVVDLDGCLIQHPAGDRAVRAVRAALQELKIPPYDEKSGRGIVRHILVRVSFASGEALLILVTKGRELPASGPLVELLRERVDQLAGIVQNVNPGRGNAVLGTENITLWGRPYLVDLLGDLRFRVSPHSFFQVNPAQTEVLYKQVLRCAGLTGRETVCDLYCGIGAIALYLARGAARVIGVEAEPAAVADARFNASLNGIGNAAFYEGRAEAVLPRLLQKGGCADVVVLDPPRKGCEPKLLETVAAMAPERVVYVSCNPATLARDLKLLAQKGYAAAAVRPVDMFPHTSHIECVIGMQRKDT